MLTSECAKIQKFVDELTCVVGKVKMYQNANSNVHCQDFTRLHPASSQRYLPTIQEGQYLDVQLHNAEINLECDENIEEWGDLDSYSMYSNNLAKDNSFTGTFLSDSPSKESDYMQYNGSPPPNSPVTTMTDLSPDLSAYKEYVDGMLKLWRESTEASSTLSTYTKTHVQLNLDNDPCVQASFQDNEVPVCNEPPTCTASLSDVTDSGDDQDMPSASPNTPTSNISWLTDASTFTSPRASSPEIPDSPSIISFEHFRSISPRILRSPSPISSNSSSSPRFVRSPSPLELLQMGIADMPFEEYASILRNNTNSSPLNSSDHVVPDIDNQFRELVEDSAEFPPYQSYLQQRVPDSCLDHLVPEMIEE